MSQLSKEMIELKNMVAELSKTVANLSGALKRLQEQHKKTRQQPGDFFHTEGYALKDGTYKRFPKPYTKDSGIQVLGNFKGGFTGFSASDYGEVNILSEGKSQLTKKDIDTFLSKVDHLKTCLVLDIFPLIVKCMLAKSRYGKK